MSAIILYNATKTFSNHGNIRLVVRLVLGATPSVVVGEVLVEVLKFALSLVLIVLWCFLTLYCDTPLLIL
jgi:hypothetical protein